MNLALPLNLDGLNQLAQDTLMNLAMVQFYEFTLVVLRMSGLMLIGPIFGQSIVPRTVRVLLILAMALVITPTLSWQTQQGFHRLDANGNRMLTLEEVPKPLQDSFKERLRELGRDEDSFLTSEEYHIATRLPVNTFDFAVMMLNELAVGLLLGVGVMVFLSAFQLVGELIDQQTGIALGGVFNPGLEINTGMSGQFLFMAASVIMLLTNGHLLMVGVMVETFQTLPVGRGLVTPETIELVSALVHQSLLLSIQVAAPLFAAMALVSLMMGFLGYTVPQINVMMLGFPVRAAVNSLVLILTLSGTARAMVDQFPLVLDALRQSLTFLP